MRERAWFDSPNGMPRRLLIVACLALGWLTTFGLGAVSGGFAAIRFGQNLLEKQMEELRRAHPVSAVVAVRDLPPGTTINSNDILARDFPEHCVPSGGVVFDEPVLVMGRQVSTLILANDLVRAERLVSVAPQ